MKRLESLRKKKPAPIEPLIRRYGLPMHIRSPLILTAIIMASALSVCRWHCIDTRPPLRDEAIRLQASLHCLDDLQRPISERFSSLTLKSFDHSPPLLYVLTLPCYLMVGTSKGAAGMLNIFFLSLLILAVYGIGRRLYTETVGLIAAVLTASYPAIMGLSKFYLVDVPETAMVGLATYAALRVRTSPRPSRSILLGLVCGAGLLISWGFIIYFAGPLAYFLSFSEKKLLFTSSLRDRRRNFLLAAGTAAIVAGPWYGVHLRELISALGEARWGITSVAAFFKSLLFYPRAFVAALFLPMTLLFLIGLVAAISRRKAILLPALWLLAPMVLLLPVGQKTPRALTPVLPAAALLTAAGISVLKAANVRRGLTGAALGVSALNFIALNFGLPWWLGAHILTVPCLDQKSAPCIARRGETLSRGTTLSDVGPPKREDWALRKILSDVSVLGEGTPQSAATMGWFIAPHPRFNRHSLLYYIDQGKYPIRWARPDEARFILSRLVTDAQRQQVGDWGRSWARVQKLKQYSLPDGSEAELYSVSLNHRRHYEAADMPLDTGEKGVEDAASSNRLARFADRDESAPGALVRGPYHPLERGAYRLLVKIKYDRPRGIGPLVEIELRASKTDKPIAARALNPSELGERGSYNPVQLDFEMPECGRLDVRIIHTGRADLWIDSIDIIPLGGVASI